MARRVLPGFGLSLGYTLGYLGLIVFLPLACARGQGVENWSGRTLGDADFAFGARGARTFVRRRAAVGGDQCCRRTARGLGARALFVSGPAPVRCAGRSAVRACRPRWRASHSRRCTRRRGWIGAWLAPLGIKVAFTPLGVLVAMIFVGFPFVVRTVQLVLESLDRDIEEAATTLGATRLQTFSACCSRCCCRRC